MKERIREILTAALPLVDVDSPFLYDELDSLGVTSILMLLSEEYGIELSAADATPRNLQDLDALVELVRAKQAQS